MKKSNLIINLIIIILVAVLLIISIYPQSTQTEKILNDLDVKSTIMAIPVPTINPLATKVNVQ